MVRVGREALEVQEAEKVLQGCTAGGELTCWQTMRDQPADPSTPTPTLADVSHGSIGLLSWLCPQCHVVYRSSLDKPPCDAPGRPHSWRYTPNASHVTRHAPCHPCNSIPLVPATRSQVPKSSGMPLFKPWNTLTIELACKREGERPDGGSSVAADATQPEAAPCRHCDSAPASSYALCAAVWLLLWRSTSGCGIIRASPHAGLRPVRKAKRHLRDRSVCSAAHANDRQLSMIRSAWS